MNLPTLIPQLELFASTLFAGLGAPVVNAEVIRDVPLRVRLGIKLDGISPADALAHLKAASKGAALRAAWPYDTHVVIDPKSESLSADNESVLIDLTFPGLSASSI